MNLCPWDPAELVSIFNTHCWGGDFKRLLGFRGDAGLWMFYCEWILILEAYVNWVCFIVKIWKNAVAIFLVQFLLLVKKIREKASWRGR